MPAVRTVFLFRFLLTLIFVIPAYSQEYVLLGWNDLGMHCSNKDFSKVVVLPPYNNVTAQLIYKLPNQPPEIVSGGYTVEYSIPNNTYSVGKTNFWTYAQQLFGLPSPLPANIGLTGKGLTGVLDSSGTYFAAHGIPITPFADSDLVNEAPFQLIHLVAKSNSSGNILATTDVVIPVSNEVGCVQSGCHTSENSILNSHPEVNGFNRSGPVLCASCHSSNALGTVGISEAGPFSFRMHEKHSGVAGPDSSISTCYKCHPGPKTQCLRDVMGKNPTNPLVCQDCHGTMANVAATIDAGRRPWLDEPRCGNCHGSNFSEEPGKLYRQSKGHGGLFCSACHGSPHAIQPTVEENDNLQNIRLQGFAGTLSKCSVCHTTSPSGAGPHGILDTLSYLAAVPLLSSPIDGGMGITTNPQLKWNSAQYAQTYNVQISLDSAFATFFADESLLTQTTAQINGLDGNRKYFWRVRSKNSNGYSGWSVIWKFITASGSTFAYEVENSWNMISLPIRVDNPHVAIQFPSALSNLYEYVSPSGYISRDSLSVGKGYWLKFHGSQTINLTGVPVLSETIDVAEGWNLIGSIADSVQVKNIFTVPTNLISSSIFGYETSYILTDVIAPLKGYWMKADGVGKVILSNSIKLLAGNNLNKVYPSNRPSNTLMIEDIDGHKQILYLADEKQQKILASLYELPPIPPDGMFDVRFTSNRLLESYDPMRYSEFPLQILSAKYPITITWNIQPQVNYITLSVGNKNFKLEGSDEICVNDMDANISVKISPQEDYPSYYSLAQNYPNPFNPTTSIKYILPSDGWVSLKIYDMLGKEVTTLVDGNQQAGVHSVEFNSVGVPSGIYLYKIKSGTFSDVKKMVVVR